MNRTLSAGRRLSTWSNLAVAFNNRSSPKIKQKSSIKGLFNIPELREPEGFYGLTERCTSQALALVKEASSDDRERKMVEVFDELSDNLCKVADLAEFIRLAHPDEAHVKAAEFACGSISGIVEKLNTNKEMYDALKRVVVRGDKFATNDTDDLVAKLFLFDFEQSGIHLCERSRNSVVKLNDTILHLGQQFVASSSNSRAVRKDDVPKYVQYAFPVDEDSIVISGLNSESPNPGVRELAYRIYLHPDAQQEYLLSELLKARHELAVTCGFTTYAERALKGSVVETPLIVGEFLDALAVELKSRALLDFDVMGRMKSKEVPASGAISAWDVPYYTQKYKREKFKYSSSDYSPYFSLGACMEGVNVLLTRLYGISLELTELENGESWSEDVYKLIVNHETEGVLGHIYCDFFEREGKPNQDCHFTIQGGKTLLDGRYQQPVVVLMLNLPSPRWSCPTLLTPYMVDNLFHEMGHAMHSMLARTTYQHVTGTRCSTDFAEVPSILMEYFARDPRVLRTFARHYQTQELLPEGMLRSLCASKRAFAASEMQTQLLYSALDQHYHANYPFEGTTTDVMARVHGKYYGLPYVDGSAWQLRFSHLVGYGAKYYSYLVSAALASRIWQECFEEDPLNRTQGERYRRECLAHGGAKPGRSLVADFLQKDPTPGLLVDSLIREIDIARDG